MIDSKKLLGLLLVLGLAVFLAAACTTTKNTGTAIKEGAEEVADKTEDAAEKVGEKAEDGSITAAIKMKFANDELVSASNIDVDTNDGQVTLTGTVASQAEADRAISLARSVSGVKGVQSNLVVQ